MGEHDRYKGIPMYEYIIKTCYKNGIEGATVFKGIMGYGQNRHIHRNDILTLSSDLPIIMEIIDKKENIELIKNIVKELPFDGIVITKEVDAVIKVKKNAK